MRNEARIQARLFETGQVVTSETAETQPPADTQQEVKDEDVTLYFLPGVAGYGVADVRFSIQEGRGLVIFMQFGGIEGHEDPPHSVTMNPQETARAVDLNLDSRYFMLDIHYSLLENAPDLTELHCRAEISRTDWSVRVLQQLIADKMLHVLRLQMEAFRQMVEKGV